MKLYKVGPAANELLNALQVDAVIHTAGLVNLTDNPGLLHNVHVVGTQRVLRSCLRCDVRVFIHTSSVGAVVSGKVEYPAPGLKPEDVPTLDKTVGTSPNQHSSYYSLTKKLSEEAVLSVHHPQEFRVCILRLPAVYGYGDPLVAGRLMSGSIAGRVTPARSDTVTDFLYVKNAAHAHICAMKVLLRSATTPKASGKAYFITQGEAVLSNKFANDLLRVCRPNDGPMKHLPQPLAFGAAHITKFMFRLTSGGTMPHAPFWNLTPDSLYYAMNTIAVDGSEARRDLSYMPLFTREESYKDLHRVAVANDISPSQHIDWRPRSLSQNPVAAIFDRLAGPGMNGDEILLCFLALVVGMIHTVSELSHFENASNAQYALAISLAAINFPAIVQCATGASKRWYHEDGRLGDDLFIAILAEVFAQVWIVNKVFQPASSEMTFPFFRLWATTFTVLLGLVHTVPLYLQRPMAMLGVLYVYVINHWIAPRLPGLEWFPIALALKYLISHVPRHEPYNENAIAAKKKYEAL